MKKIKLVESPTKPGPGYIQVTKEWVTELENLMAGLTENRAKIEQGIAELNQELLHRKSLGENI